MMKLQDIQTPPTIEGLKTALFVAPHPDDNEIGAGGTIARLVEGGCRVFGINVTDGRFGSDQAVFDPDEVAKVRSAEAQVALEALGGEYLGCLGFCDKTNQDEAEIASRICLLIDEVKPQAIFTVDPCLTNEWHSDHIKTGKAVFKAIQDAKHEVSLIGCYFTDRANSHIDITRFQERKMEAIALHTSQMSETFFELLEIYFARNSDMTSFHHAERLFIFTKLNTHCWNLPFEKIEY